MEPSTPKNPANKEPPKRTDSTNENLKVIQWEDFEHELARMCSLFNALNEAKQKKLLLTQKLEPLIQVEKESLSRLNVLEEMREKVKSRKQVMDDMLLHTKVAAEDAKRKEEELGSDIGSILVSGTALSVSQKRLQESDKSLAGQRGYYKLKNLQKMLKMRQQHMVAQVSLLYPVKMSVGQTQEQELDSFPSSTRSGTSAGSKPVNQGAMTILGLHLTMLPFSKVSFFTDKKEVQSSSSALGYVGHAVSLIASYLRVPLRYPMRLGNSRSYIMDHAPSTETMSWDSSSNLIAPSNSKPAEFPLFFEGQETTRAAYAIFLLNKDLEQLLNFIGAESLGPRYVLANLKELLRSILSADFIDT